ncbi:MAG TPA: hypothetical protein VMB50_14910, partial [Myxococcales bacterium]|nr:hypothetical protein [Myxococcales bacterium]
MRRLALTFLAAAAGCCPTSGVISFPTSAGVPTAGQGGTATSGVASGGTGSSATGASNGTGATGAATAAGSSGGSTSTGATSATGGTGTTATTGAGSSGGTGQASGSAGSSGATSFTTLTVFAGQLGGQGYADGSATDARFWAADGVVADGAGHVFVADTGGNTIREIDLATGAVTTLAGLAAIYGSADGTGPAARFEEPYGLTYDGAGNLFVADTINDTIRQVVVATGAVTTIAGAAGARGSADGAGTAATFWYPEGIASDGAGHLFVSDTNNCTIREIDLTNGAAVTTLAGTAGSCTYADGTGAAASFNLPNGLAYDGTANLYVADSGNQVIRKIVVSTGVVTTLAGTEGVTGSADGTGTAASFDTPNGVAWDGAGNLLVADSDNSTIRSVVATSGVVTTIAGSAQLQGFADGTGTAATFHFPWGVGADGAGHAYVADGYNDTVRQIVEATGAVTTIGGLAPHEGHADATG